jgi:hypothetical protein
LRPAKVAASGAWQDADTYQMIWRFYETPHHDSVTCHFEAENVRVEIVNSVNHSKTILAGRV